jgi:hypothetical protein
MGGLTLTGGAIVLGILQAQRARDAEAQRAATLGNIRAQVPESIPDNMVCTPRPDLPSECELLWRSVDKRTTARNIEVASSVAAGVLGVATIATYLLWPSGQRCEDARSTCRDGYSA